MAFAKQIGTRVYGFWLRPNDIGLHETYYLRVFVIDLGERCKKIHEMNGECRSMREYLPEMGIYTTRAGKHPIAWLHLGLYGGKTDVVEEITKDPEAWLTLQLL